MFEQSLYETEPVATPLEEGDLFHKYEIKNWEFTPRLYKILGIAAAGNILAILIVGQTSLLTMKGCDSPLVGRVCQVLDTVYVGALLFGTDREYVDAEYEKTDLGDYDITFVDVSGDTPPLSYPEGYFQIANPEQLQAQLDQASNPATPGYIAPGIPIGVPVTPPSTGGSLIDTKPRFPRRNDDVIDGDLPTVGDLGVASNPPTNGRKPTNRKPQGNANDTKPGDGTTAENKNPPVEPTPTPSDGAQADKFGVFINKRPLRERAKETVDQIEAKEVKLDTKFKVTISGTLGVGKDGQTVVLKNPKPIPEPGVRNDPKMEKLVQDWILAVGDAGWFGYIERLDEQKKLKQKKVLITIEQNDTDFFAVIRAEQPDENTAKTGASGLNALLSLAAPATDGDNQLFLKAASTSSEGRILILNVHLPKPQVQEMIQRKLAEEKAKADQPNSNTTGKMGSNAARN